VLLCTRLTFQTPLDSVSPCYSSSQRYSKINCNFATGVKPCSVCRTPLCACEQARLSPPTRMLVKDKKPTDKQTVPKKGTQNKKIECSDACIVPAGTSHASNDTSSDLESSTVLTATSRSDRLSAPLSPRAARRSAVRGRGRGRPPKKRKRSDTSTESTSAMNDVHASDSSPAPSRSRRSQSERMLKVLRGKVFKRH
jgi:hypothetical protein